MNSSADHGREGASGADPARLWNEGCLHPSTPGEVPSLIGALAKDRSARVALMLGLIAEGEGDPGTRTAAREAVRAGIPVYLDLLGPRARRDPLQMAVLYLLAHFPEDKAPVLGHLRRRGWGEDDDDLVRLERVLAYQEASRANLAAMRRLMAVPIASSDEQAWRRIVASILAPLGAEAADAIRRLDAA